MSQGGIKLDLDYGDDDEIRRAQWLPVSASKVMRLLPDPPIDTEMGPRTMITTATARATRIKHRMKTALAMP